MAKQNEGLNTSIYGHFVTVVEPRSLHYEWIQNISRLMTKDEWHGSRGSLQHAACCMLPTSTSANDQLVTYSNLRQLHIRYCRRMSLVDTTRAHTYICMVRSEGFTWLTYISYRCYTAIVSRGWRQSTYLLILVFDGTPCNVFFLSDQFPIKFCLRIDHSRFER